MTNEEKWDMFLVFLEIGGNLEEFNEAMSPRSAIKFRSLGTLKSNIYCRDWLARSFDWSEAVKGDVAWREVKNDDELCFSIMEM